MYFRIKNKWSQEYFSELLGTSPRYISEMENGKRNISCDYIDHLSNIFKIEASELLKTRDSVNVRRVNKKNNR